MKKGHGLSWLILLLSILFVMQFENIVSQASKLVDENYKRSNQVFFNLNNDFEYRAQIFTIEDAFLIVGRTSVQYISSEGRVLWEKDVSSQNVSVAAGLDYFVLAEKKAGDVFVINRDGEIIAKRFALGAIESIKSFDDSYFGVLKANNELILIDQKLKTVCSTELPKGVIIDYDVDIDKQNIAVVLLDLSRKEFNSKLVLASFGGSITSGSNISGEIAYDMKLFENHIAILSDTGILYYGFDGKLENTFASDQIISSFILEAQPWLYLKQQQTGNVPIDAKADKLVQLSGEGKVLNTFEPPIAPIDGLKLFGENLVAFNTERVVIVNMAGKVVESYIGTEKITNVHLLGDKSFAIEYINHLDIYTSK